MKPLISWSIVIHNQASLLKNLLISFTKLNYENYEIIITINVKENIQFLKKFDYLNIKIITNKKIKGFGENHNFAFTLANGTFFGVINPDITFTKFNINLLIHNLKNNINIGVCAPKVVSPEGFIQETAREFPTIYEYFKRFMSNNFKERKKNAVYWIGGMFMLFRKSAFRKVNGFDPYFFLYMEDVDICKRLIENQYLVTYIPETFVVHDARRLSRKKLFFLYLHVISIIKYFTKHR
tara:strand:- start:697 stop:1410 length:714 start_codon:yes stop_codon:yes gene_type:complete